MMGITTSSVIVPNDGEALSYFYIASNMGHPLAREFVRTLDNRLRRNQRLGPRIALEAAERAKYWYPSFEFYPPGQTQSGVPYTDECYVNIDLQRALLLALSIPQQAITHALSFLGWGGAVSRYQASLLAEPTGRLIASQRVRLIQTAALRGDAASQNTLGVMYSKGYGVMKNFVRAEYWFKKAADQRYAAALYHLGVLYKVGPEGIRQDLSKSNDYMMASALAGFRPIMNQLQDLLFRAETAPRRPGQH
jgi:TPR repeat protein